MSENLITINRNSIPLCILQNGNLVCYSDGRIALYLEGVLVKDFSIPISRIERLIGRNKVLTRLLRIGVRGAVAINENIICLSIGDTLYEIDLETGYFSNGWRCDEGVRPLVMSKINDIDGFEDGIYFGGYVHNFDKKPVSIYKRIGRDVWKDVYTFQKGEINHVHSIIPDPFRNCLWVFTGDFEESAAIWKVTNGFNTVKRVVCGDQKWRGCVAFATPEGLLYATDAPFAKNHIYLLKEEGSSINVGNLSGSCIYGCQWGDKYVFSTVVEPDGRNETPLRLLFGWKRGAGIEDNYARIYSGNLQCGFSELYKEKKDLWPFIFQFGAFRFPSGVNYTDTLYFQPMATAKNDMHLIGFSL